MFLKVFLYDKAAHGMSDEHRFRTKLISGSANIVAVVGDRARAQWLGSIALAVTAQTYGNGTKPFVGEII